MKICRYDDDRMGVVRGDLVHDVTEAQTESRKAMPYALKGDAVVAALPQWPAQSQRRGDRVPGKAVGRAHPQWAAGIDRRPYKPPEKPIAQLKLLRQVAQPTKLSCAPTNYQ